MNPTATNAHTADPEMPTRLSRESTAVAGEALAARVKSLLHEGNVRRILVKNDDGRTVIEIPVTAGIVAAIVAPVLTGVAAIAALANHWEIEVHRDITDPATGS